MSFTGPPPAGSGARRGSRPGTRTPCPGRWSIPRRDSPRRRRRRRSSRRRRGREPARPPPGAVLRCRCRGPLLVSKVLPTRRMANIRPEVSSGYMSGLGRSLSSAVGPWKATSTGRVPRANSSSTPVLAMALNRSMVLDSVEAKPGASATGAMPVGICDRTLPRNRSSMAATSPSSPVADHDVVGHRAVGWYRVAPSVPLGRCAGRRS